VVQFFIHTCGQESKKSIPEAGYFFQYEESKTLALPLACVCHLTPASCVYLPEPVVPSTAVMVVVGSARTGTHQHCRRVQLVAKTRKPCLGQGS
jgi:hypothetical protein